jgi:hypothetical protein
VSMSWLLTSFFRGQYALWTLHSNLHTFLTKKKKQL